MWEKEGALPPTPLSKRESETVTFLDVQVNHITKEGLHINNKVLSKNGSKLVFFSEMQDENLVFFTHPQQLMIEKGRKSQNVGIPQVGKRLLFCIQIFVILLENEF